MDRILLFAIIIYLAYLALKNYWDRRDVENKLYIAEHVFFSEEEDPDPKVKGNKSRPVAKAGRKGK